MSAIGRLVPAALLGLAGRSRPQDSAPPAPPVDYDAQLAAMPKVEWGRQIGLVPASEFAETLDKNRPKKEPAPAFVLPDWMKLLRMQQQSVLILALRGPDGFPKHSPAKPILRAYRACVLKAAYYGRPIRPFGDTGDNFMRLDEFYNDDRWAQRIKEYLDFSDALNKHYANHLLHGIEVLGYKFPDMTLCPEAYPDRGPQFIRERWRALYFTLCEADHRPPESEEQMDRRLCDWGHEFWDGD